MAALVWATGTSRAAASEDDHGRDEAGGYPRGFLSREVFLS